MSDLNVCAIVGRLTRDSEHKTLSSGTSLLSFAIASNRRGKDKSKDDVSFFDCVVYGKTADSLAQYLTKGKQISVTGEMRQERWGEGKSRVVIVAQSIQFLGAKPATQQTEQSEMFESDYTDDIPF